MSKSAKSIKKADHGLLRWWQLRSRLLFFVPAFLFFAQNQTVTASASVPQKKLPTLKQVLENSAE